MTQELVEKVRRSLLGMGRAERQRAMDGLRSVMLDAMYQTEARWPTERSGVAHAADAWRS